MTTPQKLAFIDVAKGVRMFSKLKVWYSTMWSSVRFNINITYQIYKNKCHLFIHIGTLYSCSWEHVPLWCWWETLLSIWQRFWFSGMHVIQLLVFLIWKKKGNILLMAIQVLSLLSVYFEIRPIRLQVVQQFGIPHLFDLPIRPTVSYMI